MQGMFMFRRAFILIFGLALAACTNATQDLARPVEPLGDFELGHAIVVAPNLTKLLISREATEEEWIEAVDAALEKRFRRFSGGKFYHLGVSVEEYSLAIPAPLVPGKSAVALRVTVWDDAAQSKMNEETHVVRVIRVLPEYASTKEQQMTALAEEAALWIERWMREQMQEEGWFRGTASVAMAQPAVQTQ
jgi:hypothetical protein